MHAWPAVTVSFGRQSLLAEMSDQGVAPRGPNAQSGGASRPTQAAKFRDAPPHAAASARAGTRSLTSMKRPLVVWMVAPVVSPMV